MNQYELLWFSYSFDYYNMEIPNKNDSRFFLYSLGSTIREMVVIARHQLLFYLPFILSPLDHHCLLRQRLDKLLNQINLS